MAHVNTRCDS